MVDVGCAGILVADTFCGPLDALPQEGELLAVDALPVAVGGCAGNVAIGLVRQGVAADVIGCVGRDSPAQVVLDSLAKSGVGCQHIITSSTLPTSQTIVLLVKGQDRRFIHVFGANRELAVSHIDREWVKKLKVFYLGGLFVLPGIDMAALADLLRFCKTHGIQTVLDVVVPRQADDFSGLRQVLPHVDYFVPNNDEAARITGHADAREQARVLRQWGARAVVITEGERGVLAAQAESMWQARAFQVETVDPTGGGDAFAAGLITGALRGLSLPDALRYGCALGASATLAIGTTTGVFSAAQAEAFLQTHMFEIARV